MKAAQKQREGKKEQMMKRGGGKPAVGTEEEAEGDGGARKSERKPTRLSLEIIFNWHSGA